MSQISHGEAPGLRIRAAEDVLALVPHLLGFTPERSLVLLALRGQHLGAAVRIDLPRGALSGRFLSEAVQLLGTDRQADGMLLVLYAPEALTGPGGALEQLPDRLAEEAGRTGLPVRDGWTVGAGYWRSSFCADPYCCPLPGRPTTDLASAALGAELVFRGSVAAETVAHALGRELAEAAARLRAPGPDPAEHGAPVQPAAAGPDPAAEHGAPVQPAAAGPDAPAGEHPAGLFRGWWQHAVVLRHVLGAWETALNRAARGLAPAPADAALLAASLASRTVRDLLPVQAAVGLIPALRGAEAAGLLVDGPVPAAVLMNLPALPADVRTALRVAAGGGTGADGGGPVRGQGAPVPGPRLPGLGEVLTGQWDGAPDWGRLDTAFRLLAWFARMSTGAAAAVGPAAAPPEAPADAAPGCPPPGTGSLVSAAEPAVPTLLAWIEWARGRGSRARLLLEEALAEHPGYRLAVLMSELFAGGTVPRWTRRPATAWSPGHP
ncbi:hypothetical protein BN1051_01194 [Arthrobacter saudimassiliensis]|uniref:DUF4192 domain-containing protein n=1 Tax=Arthrobacter saudimassiliensis TaxID=1461584 RepID=A0A078MKM3_9MICC|nr:hypothetical protein BN1051_01194 [Arthrobacter saudimassiliensis]